MGSSLAVVTLALLAIAPCLFSSQAFEEAGIRLPSQGEEEQKPWPCCDMCLCMPSEPPQCRCEDLWIKSCDPKCKDCDKMPLFIYPPLFRCHDVVTGHCGKRCH